ncbi:Na+/H+ antiporter subunit E [Dietzia cinnamea]|uniref:Na+/H+ antiporter subunit E n=1 Tax=Dietzia cinnamea TaxID=321318 RepID=UPI0021A837EE|nr:Na+/H+ antiporter subunit E [Dietzia cinnamea]MCT2273761.1 Na+/H+ antiporter subunit E [Dietzia cinnamea]
MARKVSLDPRVLGARTFMTLWLAVAWVLLWGTVEIGTIVSGLLVATLVMVVLPLPRVPVEGLLRPLSTAWLVLVVAFYLIRSSLVVAWLSIRPKPPPRSAVLRAPMRLKSDFTLALAVNTLNLLPGGIVVRVDPVARYVYVHVLDAGTDEAVEQFRRQTAHVEKLYLRAFERDEDWRPSPGHYSAPADSAPSAASTLAPEEPVDPADDTDPADPDADRAAGPAGDEKKPYDPTTEEEGPW